MMMVMAMMMGRLGCVSRCSEGGYVCVSEIVLKVLPVLTGV